MAAVATGLSAPTDSALSIAAATASPVAAYQIGQYFKGVAAQNSDGQLTAAQETARAVAHGVIAAATSAAGDHNALTAAISAGGAEAAAPYVSQWLYGEKDGSKLTAEQKQTIATILSLGGAAVSSATGGSAADVVAGGQAARTAVENNYNIWQEKLLSGDYHECVIAGGGHDACSNYRRIGFPDLINVELPLSSLSSKVKNKEIIRKINDTLKSAGAKGDVKITLSINTGNGDIFIITASELSASTKRSQEYSNGITSLLSASWLVYEYNDFAKNGDLPNNGLEQKRKFAKSVSEVAKGSSGTMQLCYKGICSSITETIPEETPEKDYKQRYFIGIGKGGNASVSTRKETTYHIGNVRDIFK